MVNARNERGGEVRSRRDGEKCTERKKWKNCSKEWIVQLMK